MLKILKRLKLKDWIQILIAVSLIFVHVGLDLKLPEYMSEITRLIQTPGSTVNDIWIQGQYMLLCTLGSVASAIIIVFFSSRIAASFSRRIRSMLFNKVNSFSMNEINKFSIASLITRSTNDVMQVQMFMTMGLQLIIKAPIMATWAITKIVGKGFEWLIATIISVLVVSVFVVFIIIFVMPKFKKMQILTDNLNKTTRENLTGLRVIRAYNAEEYQKDKFEEVNEELTKTQLFTSRSMTTIMPLMSFIMSGLSLSIYWIGAYLINSANILDKLTIFSNMVVFSSYAMQVIMSFIMLTMIFIMFPRASVSAKRINEVLDTDLSLINGYKKIKKNKFKGNIVFKDVCFKYPGASECVLKNINLNINKGETVAFIGSTGSGKSTLINLIPRFFDVSEGEILIDNINLKEYDLNSLYKNIGYVSQTAVIFKGSVNYNVNFGDNNNKNNVNKSINVAQAKKFVEAMNKKYNSEISQSGTNISGGQKQRLSIARAINREPKLFIFDDSFSALDYKTDRLLRDSLNKNYKDMTKIIVAQRIGTIMDADKIVVLDEGEIVGIGKHSDLLKTCDVYKDIALSQLSKEEL